MKRLLIPIAAAGLFASCVQTETIAPEVGEVQKDVRFNAVVAKNTSRAIITGTEYDKNSPSFGTYAFYNPSTTDLLPGYERYITDEEIAHHDDGTTHFWAPKDPAISYKWPESGSLTFYSYSPYNFQEVLKDDSGADIPANTVPLNPETPRIGQHGFIFRDYNVNDHQEKPQDQRRQTGNQTCAKASPAENIAIAQGQCQSDRPYHTKNSGREVIQQSPGKQAGEPGRAHGAKRYKNAKQKAKKNRTFMG